MLGKYSPSHSYDYITGHPTIADESTKCFTQLDDAFDTYIYTLLRLFDPSTPQIENTYQANVFVNVM